MIKFFDTILSTKWYLGICFTYYSVRLSLAMLCGRPFWLSFSGFGLFLPLALGVLCDLWLARKLLAALHCMFTLFGMFALTALLYHSGSVDAMGYELGTFQAAVLSLLINGYFFLGAIRLWRAK